MVRQAGGPSPWPVSLGNMMSWGGGAEPDPTAQCPDVCLALSCQADNRDDHLTKGGGGQTVAYPGGVWRLPGAPPPPQYLYMITWKFDMVNRTLATCPSFGHPQTNPAGPSRLPISICKLATTKISLPENDCQPTGLIDEGFG